MNKLQDELTERFDALAKLQDSEKFSLGFTDYLLFIDETPPLNTIARKIFNSSFSPISHIYQAVKRAGQEYNPGKKIWLDLMLEIESLRPFAGVFHNEMLAGASSLQEQKLPEEKSRPRCITEGKLGFLKFSKQGKPVKIGGVNSQPFRLLQCLTEPFGTAKSVDAVFEAIRENMHHKSKSGVFTAGIDKAQKVRLIGFAIKELQKKNKLQKKIEFKWDDFKTKFWLEFLG